MHDADESLSRAADAQELRAAYARAVLELGVEPGSGFGEVRQAFLRKQKELAVRASLGAAKGGSPQLTPWPAWVNRCWAEHSQVRDLEIELELLRAAGPTEIERRTEEFGARESPLDAELDPGGRGRRLLALRADVVGEIERRGEVLRARDDWFAAERDPGVAPRVLAELRARVVDGDRPEGVVPPAAGRAAARRIELHYPALEALEPDWLARLRATEKPKTSKWTWGLGGLAIAWVVFRAIMRLLAALFENGS